VRLFSKVIDIGIYTCTCLSVEGFFVGERNHKMVFTVQCQPTGEILICKNRDVLYVCLICNLVIISYQTNNDSTPKTEIKFP